MVKRVTYCIISMVVSYKQVGHGEEGSIHNASTWTQQHYGNLML